MSAKPRNRRVRRQFLDKNEEEVEQEAGEEEPKSTASEVNKIDDKHKDRFDANLYVENPVETRQGPKSQLFDLEEEEDISEDVSNRTECLDGNSQIKPSQDAIEQPRNMKKRDRGKRERKKIISSDEEKISDEPEENKEEKIERPRQMLQEKNEMPIMRQQSAIDPPRDSESQDISEEDEPNLRPQKSQGTPSSSVQPQKQKHVFMHVLINQTGSKKEERKKAIHQPLGPNQTSFVYFKRYQDGFSETFQCIGQDQRPILFCENQRGCIGGNYYISLTKQMNKGSPAYVGKLRGDAAGSTYNLYDHGQQPNKEIDRSQFRVSMAYIEYESNFLGMKGPRKLKTIIPNMKNYPDVDWDMYKFSEEENLKNFEGSSIVIPYRNKQPRWNERLNSYALNFGGRVKQPSIKNFILTEDSYTAEQEDKSPSSMIFGKIDETTFALEFRHPFSLFQAFGIALSQFDSKFACE